MGDLIQFVPRSGCLMDNMLCEDQIKARRNPLEQMAVEIMNVALAGDDTAPCEYVAPDKDSA